MPTSVRGMLLERYGGLYPVSFGHCGYPGLCVRGTARDFCIGCPFLVRRPEYVDRVDVLLGRVPDALENEGGVATVAGVKCLRRRQTAAPAAATRAGLRQGMPR